MQIKPSKHGNSFPRKSVTTPCKGDIITLVGAVHINHYEKNGEKRNSTEVKVEEIHFTGGKKNNNNTYAGSAEEPLF